MSMRLSQQEAKATISLLMTNEGKQPNNYADHEAWRATGRKQLWPKGFSATETSSVFERWSESSMNRFRSHVTQNEHGPQEEILL